jgi:hypothetical protein
MDETLWRGVFGERQGEGFAALSLPGVDWPAVLKEIYGQALGLNWRESGVSV